MMPTPFACIHSMRKGISVVMPITLNGSDLTRAKIATRNDFNGGTNSGVVIDQKLTSDSTPSSNHQPQSHPLQHQSRRSLPR